jgi:hypothetical protein
MVDCVQLRWTENLCRHCRWWAGGRSYRHLPGNWGVCKLTSTTRRAGKEAVSRWPVYPATKAVAQGMHLNTHEDFGCVQFESAPDLREARR